MATERKDVEAQVPESPSCGEIVAAGNEKESPNHLDDPLEKREGRDLVWRNVSMAVNAKGSKDTGKKILDNVYGEVPRGHVTAIMGPSGSGKTSLLNVLAGRARSSGQMTVNADVRLNNFAVDPTKIEVRKKIAFVAQEDSLQVTATPREAIMFSARLRLPKSVSNEELEKLTARMLEELGLVNCADTIVGGVLIKGLSGGEKKRTSVGVELATRPALVFLDEPTSGLDSFNAVQLCNLLGTVAKAGSSVLFTIHQPSSDIFNAFDRLILMNAGRVMYQGSVTDLPSFFEQCGRPSPVNFNPADWIMNVALTHSVAELEDLGFFPKDERELGEPSSLEDDTRDALGITNRTSMMDRDETTVGIFTQTKILTIRELRNLKRATHIIKTRSVMTIAISTAIGCIFFRVASEDFEEFIQAQSTFGALLMALMANVFSTALPSITAFPEERPVFLREYSTNHYGVASYFISRLAMELVVTAFQVTLSAMLTYLLVGFTAPFGTFWAGLYLMACSATALGVLVGASVTNPSTAVELLPGIFLPQILFSGFFVPAGLMPVWLAWLRWIFPLTYGVKIVMAAEFGEGRCDKGQEFCSQILRNIDTSMDDIWWYFLVLFSLFVFFRLLALFILRSKAQKFY